MIQNFPGPAGTVFFKGSDYRFDWAADPDVSAVRRLADDRYFDAVDFRYFDVQSISATAGFTPPLAWTFPPNTGMLRVSMYPHSTFRGEWSP